jgi:hypothetical protein
MGARRNLGEQGDQSAVPGLLRVVGVAGGDGAGGWRYRNSGTKSSQKKICKRSTKKQTERDEYSLIDH